MPTSPVETLAMELAGDPLGKGYDSMSDAQVAEALNAFDVPVIGSIDADFLRQRLVIMPCEALEGADSHALALNYWRYLANTAPESADPVAVGRWKIANILVATYDARVSINLGQLEVSTLADQAVLLGLLTQTQLNILKADATHHVSRASILGLSVITHEQVAEARNNG